MTTTKRVVIGGLSYAVPFPLRPYSADERAALKQSVAEDGVKMPVVTGRIDGVRVVIDGFNRADVCLELGIACPKDDRGDVTEAEGRRLAFVLNVPRRHLSVAEQERERRERPAKAAQKQAEGKSVRAIAGDLGVDERTVRRDLEIARQGAESGDDPTAAPAAVGSSGERTVKGVNGKTYRVPQSARWQEPPAIKDVRAAVPAVTRLQEAIEGVLAGPLGGAVRAALAEAGYPVGPDGCWPPAVALAAALEVAAAG